MTTKFRVGQEVVVTNKQSAMSGKVGTIKKVVYRNTSYRYKISFDLADAGDDDILLGFAESDIQELTTTNKHGKSEKH